MIPTLASISRQYSLRAKTAHIPCTHPRLDSLRRGPHDRHRTRDAACLRIPQTEPPFAAHKPRGPRPGRQPRPSRSTGSVGFTGRSWIGSSFKRQYRVLHDPLTLSNSVSLLLAGLATQTDPTARADSRIRLGNTSMTYRHPLVQKIGLTPLSYRTLTVLTPCKLAEGQPCRSQAPRLPCLSRFAHQ